MRRTSSWEFTARPKERTDIFYCGCQADSPDDPEY